MESINEKRYTPNKFLFWAPRVLSIIYILWLMLFSLDVFSESLGFWGTAVGLFMHNVPALILLVILIISWKRELVGAIVFNFSGLVYAFWLLRVPHPFFVMRAQDPWKMILSCLLLISVPSILIGVLFLANWILKRRKIS